MVNRKTFAKLIGWSLVAAIPLFFVVESAYAKVGVASVVNGEPLSKPPSEAERVLNIGNDMSADEVVTTKTNDRAHIVFLDGSTLTVGPNSVIIIDKFVYDPATKTGSLDLRASRGVFRYVGGAISKTSEVTIKTPSATLGIRGGIAIVTVTPTGDTSANFLFGGSLTITSQGVSQTTTQAGTQINVQSGSAPTPPITIPPGSLQQIDRSFQTTNSSPINVGINNSALSQNNSGMPPTVARAAIPATQQTQLNVAAAITTGAQQGSGPQQAAGPLQGATTAQSAGPLLSSSPLQASGPLQNSDPLVTSSPLQDTGPITGDVALNLSTQDPGTTMTNVPVQEASLTSLATGVSTGDTGSIQQLQNLLSTPQGTTADSISTLVNTISSTTTTTTSSSTTTTSTSTSDSTTSTVLSPTVYSSTTSSNVSPN